MRFVSGRLKLDVKFNDRTDQYRVKICPIFPHERKATPCETVHVGQPGAGPRSAHGKRLAVDDPRAMKDAARAAISFARDDLSNQADYDRRLTHAVVRPLKIGRGRSKKLRSMILRGK